MWYKFEDNGWVNLDLCTKIVLKRERYEEFDTIQFYSDGSVPMKLKIRCLLSHGVVERADWK